MYVQNAQVRVSGFDYVFRSTLLRLPKFIANSAASTDSSQGVGQRTRTHHHTTESFEVFALTSKVPQLLLSWPKVLVFAQAQLTKLFRPMGHMVRTGHFS